MTNGLIRVAIRAACLTVLLACMIICTAQGQQAPAVAGISESEITALLQELTEQNTQASVAKKRRAWKSIIRKGNSLLDANPTAPNHYRVLAIVFQSQKRLLGLDNSERNREALFETCATLVKAPDPYAKHRLEADFLLMEIKMSRKKAGLKERAQALADLIQRYRDTPAEAKSLMMASLIAPRLHGRALAHIGLKDWQNALSDTDAAIESHQWVFNSKKPCGCDRVATLLRTKATVLEKLGQGDEAKEARKRAATATQSHSTSRYGLYHDQLDAIEPR